MQDVWRAGLANVSMLASEIALRIDAGKGWKQHVHVLRRAAEAASRGISTRTMDFGSISQILFSAAESHVRAARSRHGKLKASDARLGRAVETYRHAEAKILWNRYGECVPASAGYDSSAFRDNMAYDLVAAGFLYEGIDANGLPAYGWTESGHDLVTFPAPVGPDETRLVREDFRDIFAEG
jgi:hypothetical protein